MAKLCLTALLGARIQIFYTMHMEYVIALGLILILYRVTCGIENMVELTRMKLIMYFLALIVAGERPWVWPYQDLTPIKIYFTLMEKENIVIPSSCGRKLELRQL